MAITDLVYIDSTGYHYEDYPSFLTWLQGQYRTIYGEDTYLEADSQDGQFIAILARAFYDTAALGASVYNSQSPASAQGTGLSRVVKINGIRRREPSYSTVDLTIVGQADTVITNGVCIDTLEQKWNLPSVVTIPISGTITVEATAQEIGAVSASIGTITQIFTPTLGWQTVNNATAAIPGGAVEADAELRVRQAMSTANPSLTVFEGTIGGVANLDGVTKVQGYENDTNSTDGDGIPAHSICIVVAGGDDTEIAEEIALRKTPGTGTFGDESVAVEDARGVPITIRFQRPLVVTIEVEITIAINEAWSNDYETLIQEAVAATINATNIGGTVFITKLFAPAYLIGTAPGQSYDIVSLEIAKSGDPLGTANIDLDFDEQANCAAAIDVTIVIV